MGANRKRSSSPLGDSIASSAVVGSQVWALVGIGKVRTSPWLWTCDHAQLLAVVGRALRSIFLPSRTHGWSGSICGYPHPHHVRRELGHHIGFRHGQTSQSIGFCQTTSALQHFPRSAFGLRPFVRGEHLVHRWEVTTQFFQSKLRAFRVERLVSAFRRTALISPAYVERFSNVEECCFVERPSKKVDAHYREVLIVESPGNSKCW